MQDLNYYSSAMKLKNPIENSAPQTPPTPPQKIEVKMVQWFDDRFYKITYAPDGIIKDKFLASVTTKLGVLSKPYIGKWRGDVGNREADLRMFEAANRGKRIHAAWYTFCTGGLIVYNPWDRPIFSSEQISEFVKQYAGNVIVMEYQEEMLHVVKLARWVKLVQPEFLFSERTVYDIETGDAGTADTIIRIPGGVYEVNGSTPLAIPAGNYILDLKTGATVDDEAYLQTAAYMKCAEKMELCKLHGTIILHTGSKNRKGIEGLATIYHDRAEADEHYKEYRMVATLWERRNKDAFPKVFEFPATLNLNDIKAA